jgi:triphosphoribosyl-dephospho-CoA synthetase
LRASLALPEEQPLVNEGITLEQAKKINIAIHKGNLCDVRLQTLLNNEAILSRNNVANFDADIVDNLSFLSQARLKQSEVDSGNGTKALKGIDHAMMAKFQALNLDNKPLQVSYN